MSKSIPWIIGGLTTLLISVAVAALVRANEAYGVAAAGEAARMQAERSAAVRYYGRTQGVRLEEKLDTVIERQKESRKLLERLLERLDTRGGRR